MRARITMQLLIALARFVLWNASRRDETVEGWAEHNNAGGFLARSILRAEVYERELSGSHDR